MEICFLIAVIISVGIYVLLSSSLGFLAGVLAIVLIIFIVFICSTKSDMNDELLDKSKETNGSSRENTESTNTYNEEEERKKQIIEEEKRRKSSVFNPVIKNEKMVVSQCHPMQEIEMEEKN